MNDKKRLAIAYICARIITKSRGNQILNPSKGYGIFCGQITSEAVKIYDYQRDNYIVGRLPIVYDYQSNSHIKIKINSPHASGYDYITGSHFSLSVQGKNVMFYDYSVGKCFQYIY